MIFLSSLCFLQLHASLYSMLITGNLNSQSSLQSVLKHPTLWIPPLFHLTPNS
uniref:Uncharacterized protein n=1 Tax=Brassica oleracea var. oleracea TaxID=109376 RepID=A0A0D3E954_BRAOL